MCVRGLCVCRFDRYMAPFGPMLVALLAAAQVSVRRCLASMLVVLEGGGGFDDDEEEDGALCRVCEYERERERENTLS